MSNEHVLLYGMVEVGDKIPELVKQPTSAQLFRYSAVTWNAHRIHYDAAYARSEGYPDILVQSHLHGCYLTEAVLSWIGPRGRFHQFAWQNRAIATPGDTLICSGVVTEKYESDGAGFVRCELEERNQDDEVCAPGWAVVELPIETT